MSASSPAVQSLNVGGLLVDVYSMRWHKNDQQPGPTDAASSGLSIASSGPPILALIILHGRTESKEASRRIAEHTLRYTHDRMRGVQTDAADNVNDRPPMRELVVITMDHRNHGSRLVDDFANQGWSTKSEKHNPRHALDMYAIQTGTAKDVSTLIDLLPSYLFPNGERTIDAWAMAGVSLGGHSTWHVLRDDPRVTIGVPIIGCPDFMPLMTTRAKMFESTGLKGVGSSPTGPPTFPDSLVALIARTSPAPLLPSLINQDASSLPPSTYDPYSPDRTRNPFVGKKVLALSGGKDVLVPYTFTAPFMSRLEVGAEGAKEVWVQEDAGHECTTEMCERLSEFVWRWGIAPSGEKVEGGESPKL